MKPVISLACSRNAWTAALLDGQIDVEGVDLVTSEVPPGELFLRQLQFAEFDVSEMSLSALTMRIARGDGGWRAVPAFPSRACFHTGTAVRADVVDPGDLKERTIGVPEYQQTAAVWTRGALQHEFRISPTDVEWVMGRPVEHSHGGSTGFTPPDGIRLRYAAPEEGGLARMLADGKLDAVIAYAGHRGGLGLGQEDRSFGGHDTAATVDAEEISLSEVPGVRPLFPDAPAEARRYISRTGIVPMNHAFVVHEKLGEKYRWLPFNLWRALCHSRDIGLARLRTSLEPLSGLGYLVETAPIERGLREMGYGLRANLDTLSALMAYVHEQGLSPRHVDPAELFWQTTLGT